MPGFLWVALLVTFGVLLLAGLFEWDRRADR